MLWNNTKLFATLGAVSIALSSFNSICNQAVACPFCSAVSQTLSEEMAAMDTAAIACIVAGTETDSDAEFEILSVIRGERLIRSEQKLRVNYFGKAKSDQQFLLMGVDPPDLLWSSPLPVSPVAIDYIKAISQLPKDPLQRLEFFLPFLEHSESMLARDAYDEFAKAPYASIKSLKSKLNRPQLIEWIKDTSLPPDRKRLYLVMLGVCGEASDAKLLEELLRSDDDNKRSGLDAMIACYLTLMGADGLKLTDELFLANKKSQYADTYAAIMALRFHGTEGGIIEKERVLESMRLILDRPELADLVIPDLARWEDWTQIEKLSQLFKSADDKSSWVRVPVINYLRSCPLPEAEKQLEQLKELDPAAFKRATSFFPIPKAASGSTDSSYVPNPQQFNDLASDAKLVPAAPATQLLAALPAAIPTESARVQDSTAATALASDARLPGSVPIRSFSRTNLAVACSVISLAAVTIWLVMWLAISGAGSSTIAIRNRQA